ncbi:MAG: ATP-binding protein [Bacteroidales bacterium]|nr:ATP-binding protein [Bacteroidales bacterium]
MLLQAYWMNTHHHSSIDEFCEAPKKVLEVLRAPMEDRKVTISRLSDFGTGLREGT